MDNQMKNIFAYLIKTRNIDPEIVSEQVRLGHLYQITDEKRRPQCLFVGFDENGLWTSACVRAASASSKFKGDFPGCNYHRGCFFDPEWDHTQGKSDPSKRLLCFESYIEMISYMTILKCGGYDYRQFAYLAYGSVTKTSCIRETCELYGYQTVSILFNNDLEQENKSGQNRGQEAVALVMSELQNKGITVFNRIPGGGANDWNDHLKTYKAKQIERKTAIER